MDFRSWTDPIILNEVPASVMGFDLEMANSFSDRKGVICMIGMGYYDAGEKHIRVTIGSTTSVDEERSLIQWFLDELQTFAGRHPDPKLLSFSGLDNDIPWINERLQRLKILAPEESVLNKFGQLDLKREFYNRTHNSQISLKKLEIIFGIERTSQITSKKVSYLLTHIMQNNHRHESIPDKVMDYLRQDVEHLLLILDQWASHPLDGHNLSDMEYLTLVNSLFNLCRKLLNSDRLRRGFKRESAVIEEFADELRVQFDRLLIQENFEEFTLPNLPPIESRNFDMQRLVKKYNHLKSIEIKDSTTGNLRLTRTSDKPKGALAVVRHDGKLLMMRRAETLSRAPGQWGLPGGVFERGETPAQCAVRELWEETGLEGRSQRLLGTSASLRGEFRLFWVEVDVADISTLTMDETEVAETRWVTPEQVHELTPLIPGALEGFREFLGGDWGKAIRN